ncbi:phosphatidylserine decarboxylase [Streptomyces triculaminicus]|uniref:Phosphatidylserine decarboxylase n=2 Tax=Streptomyces TaxID=1883 RepID=A0A939FWN4_9ACTN|nr:MULTISPECIES: phosphatidylserine decarboxylase [Streptomyces]MBO0657445.1 phosphatidylserine decarboxylase [Streptomyces triculaminicus]QSY49565.1 phosphatidylserine decarboxylase [Streptomyces griseocarneus]
MARQADFWIKEQYSLETMLSGPECGDDYVNRFVRGDVYQAFLSVNSFHRWNVPVDGTIKQLEIVPGLMFSAAENETPDPETFTHSQSYQAHVNTRGLAFIECGPELGYFSYGGSSMTLVFEQGIVDEFTVPANYPHEHPDDGPTVFVRSQIARAR